MSFGMYSDAMSKNGLGNLSDEYVVELVCPELDVAIYCRLFVIA